MMDLFNSMVLGTTGLPTLGDLRGWVVNEGGNAVAIILVGFAVFYLVRQSWGKLIGFLAVAALVFFTVGNLEGVMNSLENIWSSVTGA